MNSESKNAALKRTILSLLSQKPMRRKELYPFIQTLHPGLFDDPQRRSSKGIDYGPAWKARVGSALDNLKKQGRIVPAQSKGGPWRLVEEVVDSRADNERVLRKVEIRRTDMDEQIGRLAERVGNMEIRLGKLETEMSDLKNALLMGNVLLQRELAGTIDRE